MKKVLLLGASGCIGKETISVLLDNKDDFTLTGVSVGTHSELLESLIKEFPTIRYIYCIDEDAASKYKQEYPYLHVYSGETGLDKICSRCDYDIMVNALSDFTGLKPTLNAIYLDKDIALANKESIVIGYSLLRESLKISKSKIYTIDSEHSGLVRCLKDEGENISQVYLTCSGGPFYQYTYEQLQNVSVQEALNHPTIKMGPLISVESALYLNKAYEVVEANFLFGFPYTQIDILFDTQAEYHAVVSYNDGHYRTYKKAPSMYDPIEFALNRYQPQEDDNTLYLNTLDDRLAFMDINDYPVLEYAIMILDEGGLMGDIINAAASEAIHAFIEGKIRYVDIIPLIDKAIDNFPNNIENPIYEDLKRIDTEVRLYINSLIKGDNE